MSEPGTGEYPKGPEQNEQSPTEASNTFLDRWKIKAPIIGMFVATGIPNTQNAVNAANEGRTGAAIAMGLVTAAEAAAAIWVAKSK